MMTLIGKEIGPFSVEKEIGSGAMGTVYLARFEKTRLVALKFMLPSFGANDKAMARFEREFEILKQLKHPNIVRLIAHGKYQKVPFYAMEFVEGESLDRTLSRLGKLPWEEVVRLGKQLCAALQHAHEQGIVHRDLKPSNLMVTRDGILKLTDFGIAKDLDLTQLTSANCTVGTASYMSPEQCRGERNISHKSDLYSLGIVFYELLTGQKPFQCDNAMEMFMAHVSGKFERPSRIEMSIPIWLDTLVCQLMEKKPEKRPLDATMVAAALDQVAEKVGALQSAGVDAVSNRTREFLGTRARGEDKEAARSLAEAMGRARKKKGRPFYETAWFKALGIGAALVLLIGVIAWALMPPSADSLFERSKRIWDTGDIAKREQARDSVQGPIHLFLVHYGDSDARAAQVWEWADAIDADRLERSLVRRVRTGFNTTTDDEAERLALAAFGHEEAGEFLQAAGTWQGLLKFKGERDRHSSNYHWYLVAERHLQTITTARERLAQVQQKVALIQGGQEYKPETESESAAIEAVRYEQFGDAALASRRWAVVKQKNDKEGGDRTWFLLGAWQSRDLKTKAWPSGDEDGERLKLVQAQLLRAAEHRMANRPADALRLAREIQALYVDNTDLKEQVKQAGDLVLLLTPMR